MKTIKTTNKTILVMGMAFALVVTAWMPGTANAQDEMKPMKGAEHMRMLSAIDTPAQAEALKPGDEIAMVCPQCKTVSMTFITKDNKNRVTLMTPGEKHLCPGCKGVMEVVGVGKGKHDVVKHVCSMCGSDSAFCCATTTNAVPTTGMETQQPGSKIPQRSGGNSAGLLVYFVRIDRFEASVPERLKTFCGISAPSV